MIYTNYWDDTPEILTYLCSLGEIDEIEDEDKRLHALRLREAVLQNIREFAEPGFEDLGDDMCRWLDWIKLDDTTDFEEIGRRNSAWRNRLSDEEKQAMDNLLNPGGIKRDASAKSRKISHLHHRKPPGKR